MIASKIRISLIVFFIITFVIIINPTFISASEMNVWYLEEILQEEKLSDVGQKIPDLAVTDQKQEKMNILDLEGKVLIAFWASWCPYSQNQLLFFRRYHSQLSEMINLVLINYRETKEEVKEFIEENDLEDFKILIDEEELAGNFYNVEDTPTLYFVDSDDYLRIWHKGAETNIGHIKSYIDRTKDFRKAPLLDGEILSAPEL